MTAFDAFNFSEKDLRKLEDRYQEAMDRCGESADRLLADLVSHMNVSERQAMALGIMVGLAGRRL